MRTKVRDTINTHSQFVKNVFFNGGSSLLKALNLTFFLILFSSQLSSRTIAEYGIFWTFVIFFRAFITFGIPQFNIKEISGENSHSTRNYYISTNGFFILIGFLLFLIIFIILLFVVNQEYYLGKFLIYYILITLFQSIFLILESWFKGLLSFNKLFTANVILHLLAFMIKYIFILAGKKQTVVLLRIDLLMSFLVIFFMFISLYKIKFFHHLKFMISKQYLKYAWNYSKYIGFSVVLYFFYTRFNIVYIQYIFKQNISASFILSINVIESLIFIFVVMNTVFFPYLNRVSSSGSWTFQKAKKIFYIINSIYFSIGAFLCLGLLIFVQFINFNPDLQYIKSFIYIMMLTIPFRVVAQLNSGVYLLIFSRTKEMFFINLSSSSMMVFAVYLSSISFDSPFVIAASAASVQILTGGLTFYLSLKYFNRKSYSNLGSVL